MKSLRRFAVKYVLSRHYFHIYVGFFKYNANFSLKVILSKTILFMLSDPLFPVVVPIYFNPL